MTKIRLIRSFDKASIKYVNAILAVNYQTGKAFGSHCTIIGLEFGVSNFSGSEAGSDKNLLRVSCPDPFSSWPRILRFRFKSRISNCDNWRAVKKEFWISIYWGLYLNSVFKTKVQSFISSTLAVPKKLSSSYYWKCNFPINSVFQSMCIQFIFLY